MKWILAAMALSVSFMVGCQCTEKATEVEQPAAVEQPADEMQVPAEESMEAPAEGAPAEGTEVPADTETEGAPTE